MKKITKAVFPVAGLGSRFLPATKAQPKEMLPIVDKPPIQYAVEEAVEAGITEMIFITGRNKRAIEDHFENIGQGAGGEIQLTDGIAELMKSEQVLAYRYRGQRYDCGSKLGYLKATMAMGVKHAEVGKDFAAYLREVHAVEEDDAVQMPVRLAKIA
ncbi:sugar phosphate nucleotidyltransferase [Herbaspirillum sp. RV1423]|uniref:sugar phosphate nucleotidyltransferase n=1 Tax=Herbaspirillum sp. RV1423 TaxID=1443993 RepID=UPI0004ADFA3C|nr:sugar phosphate nucleotidyltransferase [Herbaspirillum sp. RV1423]